MNISDTDTRPFHTQRRNVPVSLEVHRAIIERDELAIENAQLAADNARLQLENEEAADAKRRAHELGNRCMIAEGQAIVLRDALGIALLGGKPGDVAWAREIYRRTTAGDDIGVLVSQIQRVAAEVVRRKRAATGDGDDR